MTAFIVQNLKRLFSLSYLIVVLIYCSFAWFLASPQLNPTAIYSSVRLTEVYDLVLSSIMTVNFFLFVVSNFKWALRPDRREILAIRLADHEIFWGLMFSYVIFFSVGFALPAYGVAFAQQLVSAPHTVSYPVFAFKMLGGVFGYMIFWVVLAAWMVGIVRNEFTTVLLLTVLYGCSQILSFLCRGIVFNLNWLNDMLVSYDAIDLWQAPVLWCLSILISILIGRRIGRKILEMDLTEPYREGFLSRLCEKAGADLSMYHYRMMGLTTQKILVMFSLIGFIFVISLARTARADLSIFAKIYLGAVFPLVFSFNQYSLIRIDVDAGMTHNNFLRKISYPTIIFNRWRALLGPQLLVAIFSCGVLSLTAGSVPLSFVVYVLLLNALCSIVNLFFAVSTQTNVIANLFLFFFMYVQLREDTQRVVCSLPGLQTLNVFSPLSQTGYDIVPGQWVTTAGAIIVLALLTKLQLERVQYVHLEVR